MIVTRIALVIGAAALVGACVLAIMGLHPIVAPLLTVVVLLALIAGGNYFSARHGRRTPYPGPPSSRLEHDEMASPPPTKGPEGRP